MDLNFLQVNFTELKTFYMFKVHIRINYEILNLNLKMEKKFFKYMCIILITHIHARAHVMYL